MPAQPEYLPTPRQIADQCRKIRNRWTAAERQRRLVGFRRELAESMWVPPRVDTTLCTARVRRVATGQSA